MVLSTGQIYRVAIEAHGKHGYSSLTEYQGLAGPGCGLGIDMAISVDQGGTVAGCHPS